MDEPNNAQVEILTKIHDRLVDLTKMIADMEMAKTNSEAQKTKLRQVLASAQYIGGVQSAAMAPRERKVIAPTDTGIQPGEGNQ